DESNVGNHEKRRPAATTRRKNRKKRTSISDSASSASSSKPQQGIKIYRNQTRIRVGSSLTSRRSVEASDVDALALPLGMSIAAVVSQVSERNCGAGEKLSVDYMSEICTLAVRESLQNVFGNKFSNFVTNFEKSFRSTLMTLRLISDSSRNSGGCLQADDPIPDIDSLDNAVDASLPLCPRLVVSESLGGSIASDTEEILNRSMDSETINLNNQLIVRDTEASSSSSMLVAMEKSVLAQTRSNDLKAFEIGLMMKNLQLQERKMALRSDSNILERCKLSMGFSKASFKAEKFKTQIQEARQVELLRKCLDFLVAGLIIMLLSLAYGTYIYSYRRIVEVTEACSPHTESKSWWMPKTMSAFNSGLQLLKCQIQAFSRLFFGALMIGTVAFLLIQRSAASHQTMPVTFTLLLLGLACGYAGKFCVDTLGGGGNRWLIYWETLCLLHFFSNVFHSTLLVILNGPVTVAERRDHSPVLLPYWVRRLVFYGSLVILPLLCGFMPFASPREWYDHFSSGAFQFFFSSGDD
ncbi:hypothetical protein M569_01964, partial [Genlisea aurea]